MNPENAIELRDISLVYKYKSRDETERDILNRPYVKKMENRVIDHLDLDVKKGEILGIIGLNGAGKSTLLRIMARILEPDSGTVEVSGKIATILELGMGFHGDLSGRENIILKGELYGFTKKQMKSKMESIIDYSGIRKYIDNPVRTYSSGMRSRLAFSIMIHVDAEIMLVDEILSTGDATFSVKASDYFKRTLKDGKTVVFVSHSPGSIESICTRAIWLKDGKIVADGTPKKVSAIYHEAIMESFDLIKDQAESGLADAQLRLAHIYCDGNDEIEPDANLYEEWLRKAADQGSIEAMIEYADLLIELDKDNNLKDAIAYYELAANKGNSVARNRLSIILGHDASIDHQQLRDIFKTIASQGNPKDIYAYANFLNKTATSRADKEVAFSQFKYLSDKYNHPDALMQLATMYRLGIGTKRNKKMYLSTIKKCADLGVTDAIKELADIYQSGTYVDRDETKAFEYNLICAKRGVAKCQYTVATMYMEGIGTEKDNVKAKEWFEIYSLSNLVPYQIKAIELLKDNGGDQLLIDNIYDKLAVSSVPIAIQLMVKTRASVLTTENLDSYYYSLSQLSGKSLLMAYKYMICRNDSNLNMLYDVTSRLIYTGNSNILYKYYVLNKQLNDTDNEELASKCLELSAKRGNKGATKEYLLANNS